MLMTSAAALPTLPRRASGSPTAAETDALFDFEAPQLFVDLRAASTFTDAEERDPWFDEVHEQHSRPSAELARELTATPKRPTQRKDKTQDKTKEQAKTTPKRQLSPGSEKENRGARKPSERAPARKFLSLREARAKHEPFQVATTKVTVKSVAAPVTRRKRVNPANDADSSDSSRSSDSHSPTRRRPLGSLGNKKAKKPTGSSKASSKPTTRAVVRPQQPVKRSRPGTASSSPDADLKEMLARHNKKFKAQHTYEPPQHSVRDVKMWERETKQSFYALSVEERRHANEEIALWLKERREARLDRVTAR